MMKSGVHVLCTVHRQLLSKQVHMSVTPSANYYYRYIDT